jgi:sirohydrochlorin ferrochelatase
MSLTLLVDNGSLAPAATLALRGLAVQLAARLGRPVAPVSLLHSAGIDPTALNGEPAELLFPALERRLAAGPDHFIILPLFFGPSRALTDYVPENLARLRGKFPALRLKIAPPLHAAHDNRLAQILARHIRDELDSSNDSRVVLADHGSPVAAVTAVRNELAQQVTGLLGARVAAVAPASMERRAGPDYDFCRPLLADLLTTPPWHAGRVIVAMQFLLPGRHAGPAGDVAEICRAAEAAHPALKTRMTKLVAEHPLLLDILADRWRAAR